MTKTHPEGLRTNRRGLCDPRVMYEPERGHPGDTESLPGLRVAQDDDAPTRGREILQWTDIKTSELAARGRLLTQTDHDMKHPNTKPE